MLHDHGTSNGMRWERNLSAILRGLCIDQVKLRCRCVGYPSHLLSHRTCRVSRLNSLRCGVKLVSRMWPLKVRRRLEEAGASAKLIETGLCSLAGSRSIIGSQVESAANIENHHCR